MRLAKKHGVSLRQSYERVGKLALIAHQRYAHAKQFKRANRALRTLRTYLGRVIRDIVRKIGGDAALRDVFAEPAVAGRAGARSAPEPARPEDLFPARAGGRMHRQGQGASALRVRRQGLASPRRSNRSKGGQFIAHVKALPGNPYDGHTLATVIPDIEAQIGATSSASSPTAAIAATTLRPSTSSGSTSPARSGASPTRSSASCDGDRPSSPSSATLKAEHRMGRNYLAGAAGDAINAVLAAAGYNFRRLLAWLATIWRVLIAVIFAGMKLPAIAQPA